VEIQSGPDGAEFMIYVNSIGQLASKLLGMCRSSVHRHAKYKAGIQVVVAAESFHMQTWVSRDDAGPVFVPPEPGALGQEIEEPTALEAPQLVPQLVLLQALQAPQEHQLPDVFLKRLCTQIEAKGPLFRQTQYFLRQICH